MWHDVNEESPAAEQSQSERMGAGKLRYTSGTDPATGKLIRHSIYGKTQKEVASKLREVTRDIDEGSFIEPAQYTVAEWMQTYLDEYTMNLKPYALHSYEAVIRNLSRLH